MAQTRPVGWRKGDIGDTYSSYKDYAIQAAKDLLYPQEVLDKLEKATEDSHIQRIMTDARNGVYGGVIADKPANNKTEKWQIAL